MARKPATPGTTNSNLIEHCDVIGKEVTSNAQRGILFQYVAIWGTILLGFEKIGTLRTQSEFNKGPRGED